MLLRTPVTAVLALLLLGVNVSLAASRAPSPSPSSPPSPLHLRSGSPSPTTAMTSLASGLLAVLTNATSTANIVAGTAATNTYRSAIEANAAALDSYARRATSASAAARATLVCQASKLLFGQGVVVTQQASTYTSEEQENWSSTCWLPAACFIRIQSKLDLALVLKLVTVLQATFAVRSGGHNPNPGFGSVGHTGVLFDLSALNEIVLSPQNDVVSVGPGATWDQVYKELEKDQLTTVGGRVAGVGVGGLILGGGMSHFSNYWGMVCDNVKNFELVLANSEIVNANTEENSDLFRALKGGGPNFGIVTRYDLYTHPDYQVWYTFNVYSVNDSARVMTAAVQVQQAMAQDSRAGFFLSVSSGAFVAGMVYLGWVDSRPSAYSAFDAITPIAVAVPATNGTALSVSIAASTPGTANREIGAVTVAMDVTLYNELFAAYQGIVNSASVSSTYSLAFAFQPVAAPSVQQSQQRGGNSLGVSPVAQSWLALVVQWTDNTEDTLAKSQLSQLFSSVRSTANARGQLLGFEFMNDSGYAESPLRSYGASNLASLNAASQKYDHTGVFQRLQNSGFLLSTA